MGRKRVVELSIRSYDLETEKGEYVPKDRYEVIYEDTKGLFVAQQKCKDFLDFFFMMHEADKWEGELSEWGRKRFVPCVE